MRVFSGAADYRPASSAVLSAVLALREVLVHSLPARQVCPQYLTCPGHGNVHLRGSMVRNFENRRPGVPGVTLSSFVPLCHRLAVLILVLHFFAAPASWPELRGTGLLSLS